VRISSADPGSPALLVGSSVNVYTSDGSHGTLGHVADPGEYPANAEEEPVQDLTALAELAKSGDTNSLDVLMRRVHFIAHRYSRGRLARNPRTAQLADDVAQEICVAGYSALSGFRDRGRPFEAFVHGIASHKVADAQRTLMRTPIPVDEVPDVADDDHTPEDRAVQRSEVTHAHQLLANLPGSLREVLLLRVAAGLTAEETARALGMTPGAVRVAQHRALVRMREHANGSREVVHE
jgi:RNA polymerase sigma-70 factor, ECF subfamily